MHVRFQERTEYFLRFFMLPRQFYKHPVILSCIRTFFDILCLHFGVVYFQRFCNVATAPKEMSNYSKSSPPRALLSPKTLLSLCGMIRETSVGSAILLAPHRQAAQG